MPVESELERGARMKSVGILSPSYTVLYRYMHFLENQVRYVSVSPLFFTPFSYVAAFFLCSSLLCLRIKKGLIYKT